MQCLLRYYLEDFFEKVFAKHQFRCVYANAWLQQTFYFQAIELCTTNQMTQILMMRNNGLVFSAKSQHTRFSIFGDSKEE